MVPVAAIITGLLLLLTVAGLESSPVGLQCGEATHRSLVSLYQFYFNLSLHSAVTTAAQHRCMYCHPDETQILTRQCNWCYSDFIIGISEVLLTTTTGYIDSLTYIMQPYSPLCNSAGHTKEGSLMTYIRRNT
jgi:hypothetical protein